MDEAIAGLPFDVVAFVLSVAVFPLRRSVKGAALSAFPLMRSGQLVNALAQGKDA